MAKIILGRRGSGKTFHVLEEIKNKIKEKPLGSPIILIAPKQTTYMLEETFAKDSSVKGSMRASVYGFERLAWRIMSEEGGLSEEMISKAGVEMMTFLSMRALQDDLHLFKTSSKYYGFSQKLSDVIKELKKYDVTPNALFELTEADIPVRTKEKLHDIAVVFQALEEEMSDLYIQSEDVLQFLMRQIPVSKTVENADIYIDGFHNFTSLELEVIAQLAKFAKSLTVTLTLDLTKDNQTFRKTRETYDLLREVLNNALVQTEVIQLKDVARFHSLSLKMLEQEFDNPIPIQTDAGGISLSEAQTMRQEAEHVARDIHRAVRTGKHRYADIAVLYREEGYIALLEEYLAAYDIPYYTDSKQLMIHHPVIELMRSLLDFAQDTWNSEALFRALKTGLLSRNFNDRDLIYVDMLENVSIERGLTFRNFSDDKKFTYDEKKPYNADDFSSMNDYRHYLTRILQPFTQQMKDITNATQFATTLFTFIMEQKIPDYLMAEKDRLIHIGDNEAALRNEQVYQGIINLMDDFVEILKDEYIDSKTMKEMFDVGLASLEFSSIPQKMDEVQLLNLDLARVENIPCVYITGFNEDVLPRANKDNGLITDRDKTIIETHSSLKLAPSALALTMDESFVAYQALTNASSELHISYSMTSEGGEARQISSYSTQLRAIFPDLETLYIDEITQPFILMETIETGIPSVIKHQHDANYKPVIEWLKEVPIFNEIYALKDYHNQSRSIQSKAISLYGDEIKASVSRFESYNNCPFQHFAAHGLRLNERIPFEFQNFEMGNVFHSVLKIVTEELRNRLFGMSQEEIAAYVSITLKDILPKVQYQVLYSRAYYQFIISQMTAILTETLEAIKVQQTRTKFKMTKFEQYFSASGAPFKVQTLHTKQNIPIILRGQIDRLDILERENDAYVSIIDYKSSNQSLDLTAVYFGKQMQMMTYMDVALQNKQQLTSKAKLHPAAMLYFHVNQPFIKYKSKQEAEQHHQKYFEAFKMDGYVVDDLYIAEALDTTLQTEKKSSIIPITMKNDGDFSKSGTKILTENMIEKFIDINRSNFVNTASHIMDGDTSVAPLEFKDKLPCDYCAFKPSCHIDPLLNSGDIRKIPDDFDIKNVMEDNDETETE